MLDDGLAGEAVVEADTTRAGVLGAGEATGMPLDATVLTGDAADGVDALVGVPLAGVEKRPWKSPGAGACVMVL